MSTKVETGLGWYFEKKYNFNYPQIKGGVNAPGGCYWPEGAFFAGPGGILLSGTDDVSALTFKISKELFFPHLVGRIWITSRTSTTEVMLWISHVSNKSAFEGGLIPGVNSTGVIDVNDKEAPSLSMPGFIIYEMTEPGSSIEIGEDPGLDHYFKVIHDPNMAARLPLLDKIKLIYGNPINPVDIPILN